MLFILEAEITVVLQMDTIPNKLFQLFTGGSTFTILIAQIRTAVGFIAVLGKLSPVLNDYWILLVSWFFCCHYSNQCTAGPPECLRHIVNFCMDAPEFICMDFETTIFIVQSFDISLLFCGSIAMKLLDKWFLNEQGIKVNKT